MADWTSCLDAALAYAARGWPVFPCSPDDKAPLVEGGFKKATTDANLIKGWWRKWKGALIAVPTGPAIGAFIVDLDLGSPPLISGEDYFTQFFDYVGGIEHTAMVESASGGRHIYFKWDDANPVGRVIRACPALGINKYARDELDESGKRKKNAGVDCLGTDGYAIVPPSRLNDGRGWTWIHELKDGIAEPNARVLDIATKVERDKAKARPRREPPPRMVGSPDRDQISKFAQAALDKELPLLSGAPAGTRNDALNKCAYNLGQLVGAGALDEHYVTRLIEDAAHACGLIKDDGYPAFEKTLRSGMERGKAKPRSLGHVGARRRAARAAAVGGHEIARPSQPPPIEDRSDADGASADPDPTAGQGGGKRPPSAPDQEGGGVDEPDPELVSICAALPENDVGNAERYKIHFKDLLQYVRHVGEHAWTGRKWELDGGKEVWSRCAHLISTYIKLEVRHLKLSDADLKIVDQAKPYRQQQEPPALTGKENAAEKENILDDWKKYLERKKLVKQADKILDNLDNIKSARRKHAKSSGNGPRIKHMMGEYQAYRVKGANDMDHDHLKINVLNGTLEAKKVPDVENPSKEVWDMVLHEPHKREDYITKIMDVEYDRDAKAPAWEEFINTVQPKQPIRRFLQQFHGYAMTGLTGEQVFVFNYGSGANGKSTFIEAISELMGTYASLLNAESVTGDAQRHGGQPTPEFARLPGKRLVRIAELPRGQGLRENTIKLLTGGDMMMVRHLHKDHFDFRPIFKAVASGNDRPNIGGVDEGIWRRVKLVPWEVYIPPEKRKPMPKMLAEFKREWPGILNWLCDGLCDYLNTRKLVIPSEIEEATKTYRKDMDPVQAYIDTCVTTKDKDGNPLDDSHRVRARDMFRGYQRWCLANAVKAFGEKWFSSTMHTKGFKKIEARIREYIGVRLDTTDLPELRDEQQPGQGQVYP